MRFSAVRKSERIETGFRLHDAERKAAQKRHDFTVARAKAFLAADGSVQAREAQATIDTADARLSADLAEAELRIIRSDLRTAEKRIDVPRHAAGTPFHQAAGTASPTPTPPTWA